MRFFLHIGFDGTNYSGWQRQKNTTKTLQELLENTFLQIFKKPITVFGCGRTDAGVHASQYIIHIDLEDAPTFDLKFRLNKNLPPDIAVYDVLRVDQHDHARYDAMSRTYDYFIHWKKDPSLIRFSTLYDDKTLDFLEMQKAVKLIEATKDFRSLCKSPEQYDHTICHIKQAAIFVDWESGRMRFTITANRFLRGMVRLYVFFLLKIGSHELSNADFEKILNQELNPVLKQPAPPNGLFLSRVVYPKISFEPKHQLIRMMKAGLN